MTMLCLWFSLIVIENIPSKLSLLFVRIDLSWIPNGGFVQDLTAKQARVPWSNSCSHTASAFLPSAQHHKRGASRDTSVLCPCLSPICNSFFSLLEQPQSCTVAFGHNSFPRRAVLCPSTHLYASSLTCLAAIWLDPGICFPYSSHCHFHQLCPLPHQHLPPYVLEDNFIMQLSKALGQSAFILPLSFPYQYLYF